jgi:transposase-like protein
MEEEIAARKRYSVEQIIAKLSEAKRLHDQGLTISQAYKRLQVSDQTFYRWRLKYGALKEYETPGSRVETLSSCTGSTSISNRFALCEVRPIPTNQRFDTQTADESRAR